MITRHLATPLDFEPYLARPGLTASLSDRFPQLQCRTGWRVFLVHMVDFRNIDREVRPERRRRITYRSLKHGDTHTHIAVKNNGDCAAGGIQLRHLFVAESADTADQRFPVLRSRFNYCLSAIRHAEINYDICCSGESVNVAATFPGTNQFERSVLLNRLSQSLAHAASAGDSYVYVLDCALLTSQYGQLS